MIEALAPYASVLHGIHWWQHVARAASGSHQALIAYRTYQAEATPWATVFLVADAFESAEWYHPLAFWLAERGVSVWLMNLC